MAIVPNDQEIDDVLNVCVESFESGSSIYPGMSYGQGVEDAIKWLRGDGPNPLSE